MNTVTEIQDEQLTSKTGMWLFLFTEMLLFGGLFVVYSVYRFRNPEAFHLAAHELNVFIGTLNTIILLTSSSTIAMSITAMQRDNKKHALILLGITFTLGILFLVNKYFEWGHHIKEGIYPGSQALELRGHGDTLFYGLYYFLTGVHALHIIIGLVVISVVFAAITNGRIHPQRYVLLENGALYWHLVDLIWIFLFPLFYLIT